MNRGSAMTQIPQQPRWSGKYADLIVIEAEPNIVDVSSVIGSVLDRSKVPLMSEWLEGLFGMKLEPTGELRILDDNTVAEIWKLSKA